jgi:hypothetical protein
MIVLPKQPLPRPELRFFVKTFVADGGFEHMALNKKRA